MSAPWTLREKDAPTVYPSEYGALVFFSRTTGDDLAVINPEDPGACTGGDLALQLAAELQEAYDIGGIGGRFQVVAVGRPAVDALAAVPYGYGMEPAVLPRAAKPKLSAIFFDANGVEVETVTGTPQEVADKAAQFMILHGSDPDENGAAAAPGRIEFLPA